MSWKRIAFLCGAMWVAIWVGFSALDRPRTAHSPAQSAAGKPERVVFRNETGNHRYDTFWKGSLRIARKQSGIDFGLVLLSALSPGRNIEDEAARIFEKEGLGRAASGKGVLLLYVEELHSLKIEVSYALEPVFTDVTTHRYEEAARSFILSGHIGDFMTEVMVTMTKHYERMAREGNDDLWDMESPAAISSLTRHLSGGAGAVGQGYAQAIEKSLAEIRGTGKLRPREELQPDADPRVTVERYLASLASGIGDPELPLLTAGSRLFRLEYLRNSSYQRRTYDFYRRALPYELRVQGGLAAAVFQDHQPVWPIYLRKSADGLWLVDEAGSWAHTHLFENADHPMHKHDDNPFAFAWKQAGRWRENDVLFPGKVASPMPLANPSDLMPELRRREAALAAHPADPARYFALGDLLYFEAYWQEAAVALYRRGLELAPERVDYRWRLVEILPNLCDVDPWIEELEQILRLTPGDEVARRHHDFQLAFYHPKGEERVPAAEGPRIYEVVSAPELWPPVVNVKFPDFKLRSPSGKIVAFSSLLGQVNIVEPAGMTCEACNAFSGAHRKGRFAGIAPQSDLQSFEEYFDKYNGAGRFRDPRLKFIQILLYSLKMGPTSLKDAQDWSKHFDSGKGADHIVIAGGEKLVNAASNAMIPGFFLLDSTGKVLSDSTGHQPRDSLYEKLIPWAGKLLSGVTLAKPASDSLYESKLGITVEDAYDWIPHHRTRFSADASKIERARALWLERLFRWVDLAVATRVAEMRELRNGKLPSAAMHLHQSILAELKALERDAGSSASALHNVIEAVRKQRQYLSDWESAVRGRRDFAFAPEKGFSPAVREASSELHQAYDSLIAEFPMEDGPNKQAFFDHLCALDFL